MGDAERRKHHRRQRRLGDTHSGSNELTSVGSEVVDTSDGFDTDTSTVGETI